MRSVFSHAGGNGGFSFLFVSLFFMFFLPSVLAGQEKGQLDDFLRIRLDGKNVRDGVVKDIREVKFDPAGIVRFAAPPPPPSAQKKYVSKSKRHQQKRFTRIPDLSLAAAWKETAEKQVIQWKPRHMAGGSLALADAVLSPDNSLWVFLETHGNAPGPYATRLVFLETHSWKIVLARDYPEFYAVKAVFLGETLLLYCKGQKYRDTRDAFLFLDPATGNILNTIYPSFPVGRFSAKGNRLAVTEKDSAIVRSYTLSDGGLQLEKVWKTAVQDPAVYFTPDGKSLLAAGAKRCQELRLSSLRPGKDISFELPFPPAKIFMPGHGLYLFLPGNDSPGSDAYLLRNGVLTPIGGVSGGLAFPGLEKDHFFLLQARKGAFADHRLPGCEFTRAVSGVELRPRTKGRVVFAEMIPHAGSIGVMDSNGVFYLLFPDYAGKKYQKMILFQ